jgi:hypothetical protein
MGFTTYLLEKEASREICTQVDQPTRPWLLLLLLLLPLLTRTQIDWRTKQRVIAWTLHRPLLLLLVLLLQHCRVPLTVGPPRLQQTHTTPASMTAGQTAGAVRLSALLSATEGRLLTGCQVPRQAWEGREGLGFGVNPKTSTLKQQHARCPVL